MKFAGPADYEECRRLHRQYGSTYYFATRFFPAEFRQRVHAVYGFVRVPDEWVDNPQPEVDAAQRLRDWQAQLISGVQGCAPEHPVMRAFVDVVRATEMDLREPLCFLDAMEMDLTQTRYETYEGLRLYMRGSAAAVGLMMCDVIGVARDERTTPAAIALGEAMQLTNFLRDVGEDLERGRIYLPLEDLRAYGVTETQLRDHYVDYRFVNLMRCYVGRARLLYQKADAGIPHLPKFAQKPVKIARILYARILDRIEERDYNVFTGRARTSHAEKLWVAGREIMTA